MYTGFGCLLFHGSSPFLKRLMNDAQTQSCTISLYSVASPAITGILYGIAFALYWLCVQSLCLTLRKEQRRRAIFTLTHISLLMVLVTFFVVLSIGVVHLSYINHVGFAQGLSNHGCQPHTTPPVILAFGAIWTIIQVLTLGVQVS